MFNITYDCSFTLGNEHKIAVATGVGYVPPLTGNFPVFSFSMQVNYLFGEKNHYLEIGTGITFPEFYFPTSATITHSSEKTHYKYENWTISTDFLIPLRIGYRYQRDNGGFFWKIAFVPMFSIHNDAFFPSAGIAIGYTFKSRK